MLTNNMQQFSQIANLVKSGNPQQQKYPKNNNATLGVCPTFQLKKPPDSFIFFVPFHFAFVESVI